MSSILPKIDLIDTSVTRPADSSNPTQWEFEKDQWGNIINNSTLAEVDQNSVHIKEVLYFHDQEIDKGLDADAVEELIIDNMLTDGIKKGLVYLNETGSIEINNDIDRHINVQGVDFIIRDYYKQDPQTKWRPYFKNGANPENYVLISDDYNTLNSLITTNSTAISGLTTTVDNLIINGLGSDVWKNDTLSGNATSYGEAIYHGNSITLEQTVNNPTNFTIKSNNTFITSEIQENSDTSTIGKINFNSNKLSINYVESNNTETPLLSISKSGVISPILGKGNFSQPLSSITYLTGVNSSGSLVEINKSEIGTGGGGGGGLPEHMEPSYTYSDRALNTNDYLAPFIVQLTALERDFYGKVNFSLPTYEEGKKLLTILRIDPNISATELQTIVDYPVFATRMCRGTLRSLFTNLIKFPNYNLKISKNIYKFPKTTFSNFEIILTYDNNKLSDKETYFGKDLCFYYIKAKNQLQQIENYALLEKKPSFLPNLTLNTVDNTYYWNGAGSAGVFQLPLFSMVRADEVDGYPTPLGGSTFIPYVLNPISGSPNYTETISNKLLTKYTVSTGGRSIYPAGGYTSENLPYSDSLVYNFDERSDLALMGTTVAEKEIIFRPYKVTGKEPAIPLENLGGVRLMYSTKDHKTATYIVNVTLTSGTPVVLDGTKLYLFSMKNMPIRFPVAVAGTGTVTIKDSLNVSRTLNYQITTFGDSYIELPAGSTFTINSYTSVLLTATNTLV